MHTVFIIKPLVLREDLAEARLGHVPNDSVISTKCLGTEDIVGRPVERCSSSETVQALSDSWCVFGDEVLLLV